jgi:hypothetical protein
MVDIDLLVANPRNPNKHGERQIELLAKIMNHQGWRHPITVSKRSGFIVTGHGRMMAARKLGWKTCPVDRQDFETEADEYAHLIADNKIAELSDTDLRMVQDIVLEMPTDFDVDLLGIESFKIETAPLPELSDSERGALRQMAFQMTVDQIDAVERAIKISKSMGDFGDTGSSNSNGNALARIAEVFVTQHGSSEVD